MPAVTLTGQPNVSAMLNGGAASTSDPRVMVSLYSSDRISGTKSVYAMKIYGSVDTKCDPYVQDVGSSSTWMPFQTNYPIVLSSGAGSKAINVDVRTRERNSAGVTLNIAYTINADAPIVTMVGDWPSIYVNGRISWLVVTSKMEFDYRIDQACNEIRIALVPSESSPITEATTIKSFTGTYTAGQFFSAVGATPSMGNVTYAELLAAGLSPGPGFVKVFAKRTSDGVWSL